MYLYNYVVTYVAHSKKQSAISKINTLVANMLASPETHLLRTEHGSDTEKHLGFNHLSKCMRGVYFGLKRNRRSKQL